MVRSDGKFSKSWSYCSSLASSGLSANPIGAPFPMLARVIPLTDSPAARKRAAAVGLVGPQSPTSFPCPCPRAAARRFAWGRA